MKILPILLLSLIIVGCHSRTIVGCHSRTNEEIVKEDLLLCYESKCDQCGTFYEYGGEVGYNKTDCEIDFASKKKSAEIIKHYAPVRTQK